MTKERLKFVLGVFVGIAAGFVFGSLKAKKPAPDDRRWLDNHNESNRQREADANNVTTEGGSIVEDSTHQD